MFFMTVITAMKFNPLHGAMVADEQCSYGYRKVNLSDKIISGTYDSWMTYVAGFSGLSSLIDEVARIVPKIMEEQHQQNGGNELSAREAMNLFAQSALQLRRTYIDNHLYTHYGLREDELQRGRKEKDDDSSKSMRLSEYLMGRYLDLIGPEGRLANEYVLCFIGLLKPENEDTISLCEFDSRDGTLGPAAFPYATSGSGSDVADVVLSEFAEGLTRAQRLDMDPVDGLATLFHAVDEAIKRNYGVGGIPSICILKDGELLTPEDNVALLATHIVRSTTRHYLPKRFQRHALDALFYKGEDWEDVEKAMWKTAKDKEGLRRFLTGYKKE